MLIDDLKGRRLADSLEIKHIGTLGLLKIAKDRGIIREVKPVIAKLLECGYYLDPRLIEKFLEDVGEI